MALVSSSAIRSSTDLFPDSTRPAALIYAINLLVATLMVGTGKFFTLTDVGAWGLENEMLYFMGGIVVMLLGSGRYSIMRNEALR